MSTTTLATHWESRRWLARRCNGFWPLRWQPENELSRARAAQLLAWTVAILLLVIPSHAGATQAVVARDGRIQLTRGNTGICEFQAGLYDAQWRAAEAVTDSNQTVNPPERAFRLSTPDRKAISGLATIRGEGKELNAEYTFTPEEDVALNSLHVGGQFSIETLAGGTWQADERRGRFPVEFGDVTLFNGPVSVLQIKPPNGDELVFHFPQPTRVLIQDNRQWGPSFVVRLMTNSANEGRFSKGTPATLRFTLTSQDGVTVEHDLPVIITADDDWIPLNLQLEIEPGSILDFSRVSPTGAPTGKHGWLQAHSDGTFRFEDQPDRAARFYGVNFCFSAHYVTHDQADQLAERLLRLGYNSVRIHHYERELTKDGSGRTQLDPEKLDQLDYLFAALTRRGIYVTTDLYVSRPVPVAEFLSESTADRRDSMNLFKVLVVIDDRAFDNWKQFSKNLLTHVNPYTGRAYKDDPGLAWLSLINEGNLGNYLSLVREIPAFQRAWNRWLVDRYENRSSLARAWGSVLRDDEDPREGTVRIEGSVYDQDARSRDVICFLADVEHDFFLRAARFLREELGCRALLTNMNGWTNHVMSQKARSEMDYVDDHFYVDHPKFVERSWSLPSWCPNTSPVAGGASGGRHITFTRLFDRPFTLSEYNYSGPGRYRGLGGILTGAMGAFQDWGAIWRFAYSHSRNNLFEPARMDYFNMVSDPLSQAAERASICLFLRGDLQRAPHSIAITMNPEDWQNAPQPVPRLAPDWHWAAWITRVGTRVVHDPGMTLPHDLALPLGWSVRPPADDVPEHAETLAAYQLSRDQVFELLQQHALIREGNLTDPSRNIYQSETQEITIDASRDLLVLDTPRTAGGFGPAGETIQTTNGFTASLREAPATIWVSAMDDQPIAQSRRLLITHLTDLQNTEIHYEERARQTLLDWGRLPHLVRAGRAEVRLRLDDPSAFQVWAVSTSGKRVAQLPTSVEGSELRVTTNVECAPDHGAILCYEVAIPQ